MKWGRVDMLSRVVREDLPEKVAFKQRSDGIRNKGRVLTTKATANRNQESLDVLEQLSQLWH